MINDVCIVGIVIIVDKKNNDKRCKMLYIYVDADINIE